MIWKELNKRLEQIVSQIDNQYFVRNINKTIDQNKVASKVIKFSEFHTELKPSQPTTQ
jgi:hypothetical protein